MKKKPKSNCKKIFFVALLLLLVPLLGFTANAATYEDYAPILYFEGEETCYPVDARYHLNNSILESTEISGETISYYDNIHGTVSDNGVVNDYKSKMDLYDYTVYYREYEDRGSTIVQYWMFYAFNPGEHNQHEGDWEMVQVVIQGWEHEWVAYSQHYGGQRAIMNHVERDSTHIKVYVSRGSHANYLRSFSGKLGISSDIVAANGKILKPSDYQLIDITTQDWITENVLWGELYSTDSLTLGSDGPQGPMYRIDMNGNLMWDGFAWGESLPLASDLMFFLEGVMYHFITFFIIVVLIVFVVLIYRVYSKHKRYGLGPRIISMFYIDGFNLHSIGNILCLVGIIVAILGLVSQWYVVSADIQSPVFQTEEMADIIVIDGLNGAQVYMPTPSGPTPMGSLIFPFSFIFIVSLIFMILGTIGVPESKKIGRRYVTRGIGFILMIVILIIAIFSMSMTTDVTNSSMNSDVAEMINEISGSPFGGEHSMTITQEGQTAQVSMQWGLGIGAIYFILSGIILIIAGILEIRAKKIFFETKKPITTKKPAVPPPAKKPEKPAEKTKSSEDIFCPECGNKLKKDDMFCPECGKKL